MKLSFLIDTNILIPLEPTSSAEFKPESEQAIEFVRLGQSCGCGLYLHPYQEIDMENDKNAERKALRKQLSKKYESLVPPPTLSAELEAIVGSAVVGSNSWVDNHLLAAVKQNAVHFLVTEDRGIHRKAARAGLDDRVFDIAEAVEYLRSQSARPVLPTPAVVWDKSYNLDLSATIFSSLRIDYPEFDNWVRQKCAPERRDVALIPVAGTAEYAGIAILKNESEPPSALSGKVLKICTLKVSELHHGLRFGELLLKNVFTYALENGFEWVFIEVFPKHLALVDLLKKFGFSEIGSPKSNGEQSFAKPITATDPAYSNSDAFSFHRRHGPGRAKFDGVKLFVVPIQPRFDRLLFPERQRQLSLVSGEHPFGNSIRKAYLCNASIRRIRQGDLLAFYRSVDEKAICAVGIVESTLVSQDPEEVITFVGKVTVYGRREIEMLCQKEVLAILFRQVRVLVSGIPIDELVSARLLGGAPQSIVSVSEEGKLWLRNRLEM